MKIAPFVGVMSTHGDNTLAHCRSGPKPRRFMSPTLSLGRAEKAMGYHLIEAQPV
jgi:hypothetical protein